MGGSGVMTSLLCELDFMFLGVLALGCSGDADCFATTSRSVSEMRYNRRVSFCFAFFGAEQGEGVGKSVGLNWACAGVVILAGASCVSPVLPPWRTPLPVCSAVRSSLPVAGEAAFGGCCVSLWMVLVVGGLGCIEFSR
uniref:Secreted protein n=1 Tax=Anopheles darlingi TaxID=43151 RepID=A0A2M4DS12_ANODA